MRSISKESDCATHGKNPIGRRPGGRLLRAVCHRADTGKARFAVLPGGPEDFPRRPQIQNAPNAINRTSHGRSKQIIRMRDSITTDNMFPRRFPVYRLHMRYTARSARFPRRFAAWSAGATVRRFSLVGLPPRLRRRSTHPPDGLPPHQRRRSAHFPGRSAAPSAVTVHTVPRADCRPAAGPFPRTVCRTVCGDGPPVSPDGLPPRPRRRSADFPGRSDAPPPRHFPGRTAAPTSATVRQFCQDALPPRLRLRSAHFRGRSAAPFAEMVCRRCVRYKNKQFFWPIQY